MERKPIEQWQKDKQVEDWIMQAAMRVLHPNPSGRPYRWARGEEVTEAQFDQAVADVRGMKAGY